MAQIVEFPKRVAGKAASVAVEPLRHWPVHSVDDFGRDPHLVGLVNGGSAFSINNDNGDLNFDKGDFTSLAARGIMLCHTPGVLTETTADTIFSLVMASSRRLVELANLVREHEGQPIPRIVFTKGGGIWLDEMADIDCEVLGLDWTMNLGRARALVGGQVGGPGKALQGNIDPNVLFAPPE